MGASTGLVLAATGISFANEWVVAGTPNFRVGVAGLATALIFDGIERVSVDAAVGLASIVLVTVLVTRFKGKSPLETLAGLAVAKPATSPT